LLLEKLGNGACELAVAHRRRGRTQRADTEIADNLVVVLIPGFGNQPADASQKRGYRQCVLLGIRPRWQPFASAAICFGEIENPASTAEDADGVFVLLPGPDGGGSRTCRSNPRNALSFPSIDISLAAPGSAVRATIASTRRCLPEMRRRIVMMKKTLAVLATVAAVGVTAVAAPAPAEARGRGIGPGLAFGLAAGAITAGAVAASRPYGYGYGPGYGYYGGPAYYSPGPYAYYGDGPYYGRRHYYRHW
jgi:hypothetical protein